MGKQVNKNIKIFFCEWDCSLFSKATGMNEVLRMSRQSAVNRLLLMAPATVWEMGSRWHRCPRGDDQFLLKLPLARGMVKSTELWWRLFQGGKETRTHQEFVASSSERSIKGSQTDWRPKMRNALQICECNASRNTNWNLCHFRMLDAPNDIHSQLVRSFYE